MRLRRLLDPGLTSSVDPGSAADRGSNVNLGSGPDPDISLITADSREVRPGALFAALAGSRVDGRTFIDEAVQRGASAVLADPSLAGREIGVPLITDPEPRQRLALIAARFYEVQPRRVAAVTGTNGKTSVASFVRQLWERFDRKAASLGTLGLEARGFEGGPELTTPDPVRLHKLLAELATAGIDHLALEASSHGLDQHRLDGVRLDAAAFTNLSRDHFDYHGSMEAYFEAKARLFRDLLPEGGRAVLNADIPEFPRLLDICKARGHAVTAFGLAGEDIKLLERRPYPDGQDITLEVFGQVHEVATALMGGFQVENLLAALGLVLATTDLPADRVVAALGDLKGVRGRLEAVNGRRDAVDGSNEGFSVFVDFAHTPDALAHVLDALRPHVEGKLSVVFGCGGDRDPGKRPEMGKIAVERADSVFITDDNPRSEDPATIRRAALDAAPGAIEVGDRREAIHQAVRKLEVGDVLVIAGKGHESGQIVGYEVLPFDDVEVARAALAERAGQGAGDPGAFKHGCGY
ncbi:MAG: UDP-N-acetylmuramoyl-L-alanyl-D-glutamate--2,6-diaminopimelate ligase [Pseudomonadota bacterium]